MMRYFSNSVSAYSLASFVLTLPWFCRTSLPPAAKIVSIFLAQSSIVIGIWRFASWKPILYALALKYHWHYLDMLENDFNVFQFTNQFYFPRPDHKNKGDAVSIAWSATRSENIASIWLLEHLLDKLSLDEFNEIAAVNDMARNEGEETKKFFERLPPKTE